MSDITHDVLPCGVEYAVAPLPRRHVVAMQIRVFAGVCAEPPDKLGLARLLEETLDKGTERHSGRELFDAFDAIGASTGSGVGRETITMTCTVLPEHFDCVLELHAEMLRTPTLPEDAVNVNLELAMQELDALQDDPQGLVDKYISPPAFGPILGRHSLGERETLGRITRRDLEAFWRENFSAGRLQITVAGAVEPGRVADALQQRFDGFGDAQRGGRTPYEARFSPGTKHYEKELEQQQIGICWPGVAVPHEDFPIQQVMLGVLSGGMSGRLFTEVREKLGLVYWVGAWHETPRGTGVLFLGASTKPERCDKTYETLLREVNRLGDDIEQEELDRAITGIVAHRETRGDGTRAHCGELANDLFYFGHPVPEEEKIAKIKAVSIADIKRILVDYPRDSLCVVTLGPRALAGAGAPAHTSHIETPG